MNILVVDDDPRVVEEVKDFVGMISPNRHTIIALSSSDEALDLIHRSPDEIGLAIFDLSFDRSKCRATGEELCDAAYAKRIRFIVLSGIPSERNKIREKEIAYAVIGKEDQDMAENLDAAVQAAVTQFDHEHPPGPTQRPHEQQ